MERFYFLPYYKDKDYLNSLPQNTILCTRFKHDFQSDCLLFKVCENNTVNETEASYLNSEFAGCYIYDMFNFENREFTLEGYDAIVGDIDKIIDCGFKYILVSNPYIIELLSNEYSDKIKIVISSQLEINSAQSKIFFEVLNNTANISHIILSQNYKYDQELKNIMDNFKEYNLVIEADRICSNNQIVHESYYNMLYGYYNEHTVKHILQFIKDNMAYFKQPTELVPSKYILSYKIGTLNTPKETVVHNLRNIIENKISNINIIDYNLWQNSNV